MQRNGRIRPGSQNPFFRTLFRTRNAIHSGPRFCDIPADNHRGAPAVNSERPHPEHPTNYETVDGSCCQVVTRRWLPFEDQWRPALFALLGARHSPLYGRRF